MLWIAVQGVLLFNWLYFNGAMNHRFTDDSYSYLELAELDLMSRDGLSHVRSIGYPAVLKILPVDHIPKWQYCACVMAAVVLCWGLQAIGCGRVTAGVLASTALYSQVLDGSHFHYIMTESLAMSASVAVIGLLMVLARHTKSVPTVLAICLTVFAAYQIRPTYQVFVVLAPVLGIVLAALVHRRDDYLRVRRSLALRLTAAVILPWLAFAALRWVAVGSFRLVDFGGTAAIGYTGMLLDRELADEMPEPTRSYAHSLIDHKDLLHLQVGSAWYRNRAGEPVPSVSGKSWAVKSEAIRLHQSDFIWSIYPAMRREEKLSHLEIDRRFRAIALQVVRRRPLDFLRWVFENCRDSLVLLAALPVFQIACVALVTTTACYALTLVWRGTTIVVGNSRNSGCEDFDARHVISCGLLFAALALYGAIVLGTSAFQPIIPRYASPAGVLMPLLPAHGAIELARSIHRVFAA